MVAKRLYDSVSIFRVTTGWVVETNDVPRQVTDRHACETFESVIYKASELLGVDVGCIEVGDGDGPEHNS